MLILGIDTSGRSGSIALVRSAPEISETLDLVPLEGGTFSAQLVPQIAELLQKHGFTKQQIDGFAVVSGPGSFTGLRIGLAAIKGLAEILQKPIAPVSLLEALALAANREGNIIAALDAGRGEVYVGAYEARNGNARCSSERILALPELLTSAAGEHIVTPDEKLAEALRQKGVHVTAVPQPQADYIARLGHQKLQAARTVTPEALDASYIRRTDAEIKLSTSRG
jgi:tRNA threonylcarbamoyladenosine biosynthesis protein TsaB